MALFFWEEVIQEHPWLPPKLWQWSYWLMPPSYICWGMEIVRFPWMLCLWIKVVKPVSHSYMYSCSCMFGGLLEMIPKVLPKYQVVFSLDQCKIFCTPILLTNSVISKCVHWEWCALSSVDAHRLNYPCCFWSVLNQHPLSYANSLWYGDLSWFTLSTDSCSLKFSNPFFLLWHMKGPPCSYKFPFRVKPFLQHT